jgi:hypothetical protein
VGEGGGTVIIGEKFFFGKTLGETEMFREIRYVWRNVYEEETCNLTDEIFS